MSKVAHVRQKSTRTEQVERTLEKDRRARERAGCCLNCCLLQRFCLCHDITPVRSKHKVTTLLHGCEAYRASSTHKLLLLGLQHADAKIVDSARDGSMAAIVAGLRAEAAATGRQLCLLYPSPAAVPAGQLYAALAPAQRAAGLHMLVLDGTWSNVRSVYKSVCELTTADEVPHMLVHPLHDCSLFQPLRAQPAPGRVSTLEAVACVFDDCCAVDAAMAAAAAAAEDGAASAAASAAAASESAASAAASAAAVLPRSPTYPHLPHIHEHLLPSFPSHASRRLRYALCMLVDRVARQTGYVGAGRGSGYRTWSLAPAPAPAPAPALPALPSADVVATSSGGAAAAATAAAVAAVAAASASAPLSQPQPLSLLALPAWIIERIAVLAYGREVVMESGYTLRHARSGRDWAAHDARVQAAVADARGAATAAATAGGAGTASGTAKKQEEEEEEEEQEEVAEEEADDQQHCSAEQAATASSPSGYVAPSAFGRRLAQGGLPRPVPAYCSYPLALANKAMYCFAHGYWFVAQHSVEQVEKSRAAAAKRQARRQAVAVATVAAAEAADPTSDTRNS